MKVEWGLQNPSTHTARPLSASVRFTDIICNKKTNICMIQMIKQTITTSGLPPIQKLTCLNQNFTQNYQHSIRKTAEPFKNVNLLRACVSCSLFFFLWWTLNSRSSGNEKVLSFNQREKYADTSSQSEQLKGSVLVLCAWRRDRIQQPTTSPFPTRADTRQQQANNK